MCCLSCVVVLVAVACCLLLPGVCLLHRVGSSLVGLVVVSCLLLLRCSWWPLVAAICCA